MRIASTSGWARAARLATPLDVLGRRWLAGGHPADAIRPCDWLHCPGPLLYAHEFVDFAGVFGLGALVTVAWILVGC